MDIPRLSMVPRVGDESGPDEPSVGAQLRARRKAEGRTQSSLAVQLGVSQQTLAGWENGNRPKEESLEPLARYLNMSSSNALRESLSRPRPAPKEVVEQPLSQRDLDRVAMRSVIARFIEEQPGLTAEALAAYRDIFDYFKTVIGAEASTT